MHMPHCHCLLISHELLALSELGKYKHGVPGTDSKYGSGASDYWIKVKALGTD